MAPLLACRPAQDYPSPLVDHRGGGRLDRILGYGFDILASLVDLVLSLFQIGGLLVQGRIGVLLCLFYGLIVMGLATLREHQD